MMEKPEKMLEGAGIKPTANRILVLRSLLGLSAPAGLIELETELGTVDRSSILRVLSLFSGHGLIHVMEDGRGVAKYEVCSHCGHRGLHRAEALHHAHFYCEKCEKVYCLEDMSVPDIRVPGGFEVRGVNFMLKGICPKCSER